MRIILIDDAPIGGIGATPHQYTERLRSHIGGTHVSTPTLAP